MNPRVLEVKANDDYTLMLAFSNGETRLFDMRPYLHHGFFEELNDLAYFRAVRAVLGTVQWPHEQDVCPDTLYEGSCPCRRKTRGERPRAATSRTR